MATRMCDVCGIRPAVVSVRRVVPGEGQMVEHLCEIHAAEAGVGRSTFGGRSPLGGGSLFDDFFDRFFDEEPRGETRGGRTVPRRQAEQVDITQFFNDSTTELLQRAAQQAVEWGDLDLSSEHLLYAALEDNVVRRVLEGVEADPEAIRAQLQEEADKGGRTDVTPSLAPDAKRALLAAYEESQALGSSYIGPEHVLLALARDDESEAGELLGRFGLSHTRLRGAVMRGVDTATGAAREPASATPTLDEYSRDLTQMAREGKLDPVIGRAEEVETTIEILSRRTKNNPVLIGDPGVGKTAIVEGLAQRIVNDEVPETLVGRRVLALDLSGLVAGTQYRGQFEERLKKVVDEASENPEGQILFIDELHTVVGAGAAEGSMDASNMLKPALARGELHVVGATTVDEYRKNVEKDAALERRFQPVLVGEPSAAPAPTTVCSSSMNRIWPSAFSLASSMTFLRRSSNWPRYCVPATRPERSRARIRLLLRVSGTSSFTILWARPSTMAVLPTPGSPMSTGLFLVRRDSTSMVVSTSSARPMTGSSLPSRAILVRSRLYSSRVGVELLGSRTSPLLSTPRTTAPRSPVCESPKRESSLPASDSSSAPSASSTCSGPM